MVTTTLYVRQQKRHRCIDSLLDIHGIFQAGVLEWGAMPSLNMLSRLVITFLPRSKRLLFMAAVTICSDFGAPPNKV